MRDAWRPIALDPSFVDCSISAVLTWRAQKWRQTTTLDAECLSHFPGICFRACRSFLAPGLVRLGAARLDNHAPPSLPSHTAHRFADLRHRHRVGPLAAVPAHSR